MYRKTPQASYTVAFNPVDITNVAVKVRGPKTVQTCTEVSLEATVTGTGGRPAVVVWSCSGCAALQGLSIEPHLAEAQGTFVLHLPAQVVQVEQETVVTFTISVTNFLESTASSEFQLRILNSGPPLPIVTLGTPAEQVFLDQRVNFAIETRRLPAVIGCLSSGATETNDGGTVEVIWDELIARVAGVETWQTIESDENPSPNVLTLVRDPNTLYEFRATVGYEGSTSTNNIINYFNGTTAALPPVVVSIAAQLQPLNVVSPPRSRHQQLPG
jgi:hypothetical protein